MGLEVAVAMREFGYLSLILRHIGGFSWSGSVCVSVLVFRVEFKRARMVR